MKTLTGNQNLVDPGFDQPPSNPLHLLQRWLAQADHLRIIEPRGLVLSTVDTSGRPSSRVVLLKTVDDTGIVFASSETSQKGVDLSKNAQACGTLWWRETMQQVNFYGLAAKLPPEASDLIFRDRTREAQAVAALSHQSAVMANEEELRSAVAKLVQQEEKIMRPKTWHGYHVNVETIEFWHGNPDRFHNRLRYTLHEGVWHLQKLQP